MVTKLFALLRKKTWKYNGDFYSLNSLHFLEQNGLNYIRLELHCVGMPNEGKKLSEFSTANIYKVPLLIYADLESLIKK